jgi:hypothetical protein
VAAESSSSSSSQEGVVGGDGASSKLANPPVAKGSFFTSDGLFNALMHGEVGVDDDDNNDASVPLLSMLFDAALNMALGPIYFIPRFLWMFAEGAFTHDWAGKNAETVLCVVFAELPWSLVFLCVWILADRRVTTSTLAFINSCLVARIN